MVCFSLTHSTRQPFYASTWAAQSGPTVIYILPHHIHLLLHYEILLPKTLRYLFHEYIMCFGVFVDEVVT